MDTKLIYCDTNIIRLLAGNSDWQRRLRNYQQVENLRLAISLVQVLEIQKVLESHVPVVNLLIEFDAVILKWWPRILQDEISRYPNTSPIDPVFLELRKELPTHQQDTTRYATWLFGADSEFVWRVVEETKGQDTQVLDWLPSTKPLQDLNDLDFGLHNFGRIVQQLKRANPDFMRRFVGRHSELDVTRFSGLLTREAYVYYRYILDGRQSVPSDIGDIHQAFYVPYCHTVITERSLSGYLNRLARIRGIANKTVVRTVDFFRDLPL